MNYRPLALVIGALTLIPLSTAAAPPSWAGGSKASQQSAGGAEQHRQFNDRSGGRCGNSAAATAPATSRRGCKKKWRAGSPCRLAGRKS